jgi:hypothetical protein
VTRRRTFLTIAALSLLAGNVAFFGYRHFGGAKATITYVGLDSGGVIVPEDQPGATLKDGKWEPDPAADPKVKLPIEDMGRTPRQLIVVSLAPEGNYGRFIQSIRALRARGICNLAIREGGTSRKMAAPLPGGSRDALAIPAIIVCGHTIGDNGFTGTLPSDRDVRL